MNLAVALAKMRRLGESAVEFSRVLPGEVAFFNVAVICMGMQDYALAAAALNGDSRLVHAYNRLGARCVFEEISGGWNDLRNSCRVRGEHFDM